MYFLICMLLLVAVGLETDAAVSHPVDKGLFLLIISFPGAGGGGIAWPIVGRLYPGRRKE